jgi:CheY-like chemotaxis protein
MTNNGSNAGVKVLVVDDTTHVREMLADMLDLDGFDVVGLAASGEEAVDMSRNSQPDVIVMDYKMSGMDGLAATRAIRSSRPDQIIILYTAYMDAELEARARDAGVALCIGKVEGLHQLERYINDLCRRFD